MSCPPFSHFACGVVCNCGAWEWSTHSENRSDWALREVVFITKGNEGKASSRRKKKRARKEMAAPVEHEEEVITHLSFEDDVWKARFASDGRVYPVHESSLDVDFMKPAMEKCKRNSNHGMQVAVPKGKATRGMSNGEEAHQQLTRGRRSGPTHVPAGAWYNVHASTAV